MPVSDYTPDLTQVADYIRTRTRTAGGSEAGTFNVAAAAEQDRTKPTAEQVQGLINRSIGRTSGVIGADVLAAHHESAKNVTALRAALLIELTYFPEQVATGRSPYAQLKELYDEEWADLLSALGIDVEEGGGAVSVDAGMPSYGGFPTTAIGMEMAW